MHPLLARPKLPIARVLNRVPAGLICDPVAHVSGGDLSVDHPVHALVLWEDGQVEQVWACATSWNHEHVRVVFHRRGEWRIWLRAQDVCACTCQDW